MGVLQRVDDFLIDRVAQPVADRLADRATPQALASSLIIGSAVFASCVTMREWLDGGFSLLAAAWAGFGLFCSFWVARDYASSSAPPGFMPKERLYQRGFRSLVFWVTLTATVLSLTDAWAGRLTLTRLLLVMDVILYSAGMHFAACRRNPPKPRRQEAPQDAALIHIGAR